MGTKEKKKKHRRKQCMKQCLSLLVLIVAIFAIVMLVHQIKGFDSNPENATVRTEENDGESQLTEDTFVEGEITVPEYTEEELAQMAKEEIMSRFDEDDQVIWKECASEDEIVMDFIGDICLSEGWSTVKYMDSQANGVYDCLSPDVMAELQSADVLMINNEFTLSTKGSPLEGKAYLFRGNPSRVQVLIDMGADIASLANNHAYDYGPEALVETMEVLETAGIPYVGAGRNIEEAMEPVYFVMNGKVIGFVAATQIERSTNYTKEATEERAGVLKTLNPEKFLQVIEEAEGKSDYVIAFVHWGTENTNHFESDQVSLAEQFVDAGADVIIGGHTHCLQGVDYVKGVPVIYSLGNFWFNNRTIDTGISQVTIDQEGSIRFRFIPCVQSGCETYMAEGEKAQEIITFMNNISPSGVHIDETGLVLEIE